MKYALNLSEDNRILSATYEQYAAEDAILVDELPEGNIADYLYINEEYFYDPLPKPEMPELQPSAEKRISELEEMFNALLGVTE